MLEYQHSRTHANTKRNIALYGEAINTQFLEKAWITILFGDKCTEVVMKCRLKPKQKYVKQELDDEDVAEE